MLTPESNIVRFEEGHEEFFPTLDLDCSISMGKTYEVLSQLLELEGGDPNKVYERHGDILFKILENKSPDILSSFFEAKHELDHGSGFVVLRGTQIDLLSSGLSQLAAITLGSIYGRPTRTDRRKAQVAWPVTYDPNAGARTTFSQTMNEATYHTDTQYFENPEKYFGLFCVIADTPGKGTNRLINGQEVTRKLAREQPVISTILRSKYPFRVPTVFTQSGRDEEVEVTWAPIVSADGAIRYRRDTLLEASTLPGVELTDEQVNAVQIFENYLSNAQIYEYHLRPGEAIIVNNHRLLHARTPYDNPDRLLYRVRMEAS